MSAMSARAPALVSWAPRVDWCGCRRQIRSASSRRQRPPRRRRPNPPRQCSPAARLHLGGGVQEQIRRRLAARHVARREQIGLEEPNQPGAFEAEPHAFQRRRTKPHISARAASSARVRHGRWRALPRAAAAASRRPASRRSFPAACGGCRLDIGEHVGGPPAGEEARDDLGGHRNARARQLCAATLASDRFAVNQHAIAVENDHPSPRSPLPGAHGLRRLRLIRVARLWTRLQARKRVGLHCLVHRLCTSKCAHDCVRCSGNALRNGNITALNFRAVWLHGASVENAQLSFFHVLDAAGDQVVGDLALGGFGQDFFGRGDGGFGGGSAYVGERLRLGLGDLGSPPSWCGGR